MHHNAAVKIEVLTFLQRLFSDRQATFVRRNRYIDTYIPYALLGCALS